MKQDKPIKLAVLLLADIIIITLSLYLSLYLCFLGQVPAVFVQNLNSILVPAIFINLSTFFLLGLYRKHWYHSGLLGLFKISLPVMLGLFLTYLYSLYSGMLPRSIFLLASILIIALLMALRFFITLPVIEISFFSKGSWPDLKALPFIFCSSSFSHKILLLLVICAVLINILQFRTIDAKANARYKALNQEPSSCILEFGLNASAGNRDRYSLHIELANIKHGLIIIMPSDGVREFVNRLLSFGRVAEIKQLDYDAATFLLDFDYYPYIAARGEGGDKGDPFVIVYKEPDPTAFIVLRRNSTDVLIDVDLLPEGALEGLK